MDLSCQAVATAALGPALRHSGAEIFFRCPNHDDEHPSLQINTRKNVWLDGPCSQAGNGWELAAFLAGVQPSQTRLVAAWLSDHGLPNAGANSNGNRPSTPKARHRVAEFYYLPELRKVRLEPGFNGRPKSFVWEHLDGDAWKSGYGDLTPPLYMNAIFREWNQVALAVGFEGEAKADLAATVSLAGFNFKGLGPEHCDVFAGLDVVLWPDKDDSGAKQAAGAAKILAESGKPRSIRVIAPIRELPPGGDIVDAVQALGLGRAEIDKLIADAKPALEAGAASAPVEPEGWRDLFHTHAEFENSAPLSFAIGGFLQNDGATMIGGLSGHGKTLILCSIAKALLAGQGTKLWDLFPVEENAARVVYLIPECALAPFKHRLQLFGIYGALAPDDERLLVRTLSKGPAPCLSDPRILYAAKGAHIILDTAARFGEGDENSSSDNMRGLATDIFALLGGGARSVIAAHHSPKPFARENVMRLETVLRGSGDIGAMLTTAWGIKQLDAAANVIHVENCKPRDFQPCGPFQLVGRPHIDQEGDFRLLKRPGECGSLQEEQAPERERGGGAPQAVRDARAANVALMRGWLGQNPRLTSLELVRMFANEGIKVGDSAIRKYRKELMP